jgi:hypothetical protein
MKNITVAVSDKSYRQARVWAAARDTSLSKIVQYLIETLPNIDRAARAFPVPKPPSAENNPSPNPSSTKNEISNEKTPLPTPPFQGVIPAQTSQTTPLDTGNTPHPAPATPRFSVVKLWSRLSHSNSTI